MANTAILAIRIISDARKAAQDLKGLDATTGKWQSRMERATGPAKAVAGGVLAIGAAAFKQASQLQQASGAVESVFGRQSAKVKQLAGDAAGVVGLAESEYSQLAAVLGAQLGNLGVAQDKLVGTTDGVIRQGADLAAMFGGTTAEAVEALTAAFRGETDPIEKYGISIKQAAVQAELAKRGQDKLTGAQLTAAKTAATLDLITAQAAKSQGQFAREAGSASGASQIATANFKNAAAALGTALLPAGAAVASTLAAVAGYVQQNSTAFLILGGVLAGIAATILVVNAVTKAWVAVSAIARAATIVWRNAQLALNLAMIANPVGLVIAAVVAVIAVIAVVVAKTIGWRRVGQAVMAAIRTAIGWVVAKVRELAGWVSRNATAAWRVLQRVAVAVWRAVTLPVRTLINAVRDAIGWVRDKAPAAWNAFRDKAVAAFRAVTAPVRALIGWVQDLLNKISQIRIPSLGDIGGALGGVFGFGGGGAGLMSAPSGFAGAATLTGGAATLTGGSGGYTSRTSGGVTIVLNGVIDSDSAAREIERILGRRARRVRGS